MKISLSSHSCEKYLSGFLDYFCPVKFEFLPVAAHVFVLLSNLFDRHQEEGFIFLFLFLWWTKSNNQNTAAAAAAAATDRKSVV